MSPEHARAVPAASTGAIAPYAGVSLGPLTGLPTGYRRPRGLRFDEQFVSRTS
jgi:hypothetical protein